MRLFRFPLVAAAAVACSGDRTGDPATAAFRFSDDRGGSLNEDVETAS